MTTKFKIIIGFSFMVILLAVVSGIAYRDLQGTSVDFAEFNRLAKFNTTTSDLSTYLSDVETGIYRFLDDKNTANMDFVSKRLDMAVQKIKDGQAVASLAERRATLEQMLRQVNDLRPIQEKIKVYIVESYSQYRNSVLPAGSELGVKLMGIADQAKSVQSSEVAYAISAALNDLAYLRSAASRFAETRAKVDAERTIELLGKTKATLAKITPRTDVGKALKIEVDKAFEVFAGAFAVMDGKYKDVEQNLALLKATLVQIINTGAKLSADVDTQSARLGERIVSDTAASQKELSMIAVFGLLAGIGCALFIVVGLIRVLSEMSRFAGAVAAGDFNYQIRVKEKGEIGAMVTAMQAIPKTLNHVIAQARDLANRISSGHMRERLDASALPGTFGQIATATNAVGDAYLNLIDAMDMSIMACDKSNTIIFLNHSAQKVVGGNLVNQNCGQAIKAKECGTGECIGNCAMSKNSTHAQETIINARAGRMNVNVTSLPLRDLSGQTAGYVEVLTDITEIRTQQAAVMKAVAQASEISDRVAAASEELAAQVEQISRGAERQRERVESTASAMSEMNSTVLEVARNAGQASEQSEETRKKAEGGSGLVNRVVQAINTVNAVAQTLQTNMQELGQQAESIGGVMNVISDIADQTNLLALNAAIEAARAGEAGRGFAVVADEVRKLAENTMKATQEVGQNIKAIQSSTRVNIEEVGNAAKSVHEATDLANSSGAALKEIVDLASANSSIVTSIATAAEEQSATSEEINLAVEEISRITGETTDGMTQSSSAVQDLSRMAQELRRVMETLR